MIRYAENVKTYSNIVSDLKIYTFISLFIWVGRGGVDIIQNLESIFFSSTFQQVTENHLCVSSW